jgi:hypothetical protein
MRSKGKESHNKVFNLTQNSWFELRCRYAPLRRNSNHGLCAAQLGRYAA